LSRRVGSRTTTPPCGVVAAGARVWAPGFPLRGSPVPVAFRSLRPLPWVLALRPPPSASSGVSGRRPSGSPSFRFGPPPCGFGPRLPPVFPVGPSPCGLSQPFG
jgi:hypothetical protein